MKSKRATPKLSVSVHQYLNTYALAAGAAGVSALALTQPSEAKIVYSPANVHIGENHQYKLDLDHNGIKDFIIQDTFRTSSGCNLRFRNHRGELFVMPERTNSVEARPGFPVLASALTKGMHIGPIQNLGGTALMAVYALGWEQVFKGGCQEFTYRLGYWSNVQDHYLGLMFMIRGKVHYGWARICVSGSFPTARLTGYAYETIVGKSIKAGQTKEADDSTNDFSPSAYLTTPIPDEPQPASLGMLALGAQAVPLWRRKESAPDSD